jgi:hypothetical protein
MNFSVRVALWKDRSVLYVRCFTDSTEQKSEFASCPFVSFFFQCKCYTLLRAGREKGTGDNDVGFCSFLYITLQF